MKINEVIIAPVLTEKATNLAKGKLYPFKVNKNANKFQIKTALENLYQIKVGEIRVKIQKGKKKRVGKKLLAKRTSDVKIAYVSLVEGKIDLFPQT
jgi:large subunit ribosomal protein L23